MYAGTRRASLTPEDWSRDRTGEGMRGPRVCLCLVLLAGVLAAQSARAHAAQPSTNALEQHWELLAETGSYTGSKTLEIRRGDLPGGTTRFEPAPTATLEVVGKHTGGSGASKWEVALMATSTEVLATVDFLATDVRSGATGPCLRPGPLEA